MFTAEMNEVKPFIAEGVIINEGSEGISKTAHVGEPDEDSDA